MTMVLFYVSAILMVATAVIHSVAGEKRIIGPLLARGKDGIPSGQSRRIMRSAWHLTSAFMVTNAAVVAWPGTPNGLIIIIGAFWLLVGAFSLIASRGKHVGWPTLTAAGVTALLGVWI
jgi:predicted anti-sigma-YlaC factor YlaD